jgi:tetratricopeptide (TPR) repeat protein
MALFGFFKKDANSDTDYLAIAQEHEQKGDYLSAIVEYEKLIQSIYKNKEPKSYRHITKKVVDCFIKIGDYDKVLEYWKLQYDPTEYSPKEMFELIKVLEQGNRHDLIVRVYDVAGNSLLPNRIEYLIKQKKIPEANALLSELLSKIPESNPSIKGLWFTKAKLSMSLRRFEEANKYLGKLLEKDQHNLEARKLKDFCMKQINMQ